VPPRLHRGPRPRHALTPAGSRPRKGSGPARRAGAAPRGALPASASPAALPLRETQAARAGPPAQNPCPRTGLPPGAPPAQRTRGTSPGATSPEEQPRRARSLRAEVEGMPARTGAARRPRSLPAAARAAHPWVGACLCGAQGFRFAPARRMIGAGPRGIVAQAKAPPAARAGQAAPSAGPEPGQTPPLEPPPRPRLFTRRPVRPARAPPGGLSADAPGPVPATPATCRRMRPHVPAACRDGKNACPPKALAQGGERDTRSARGSPCRAEETTGWPSAGAGRSAGAAGRAEETTRARRLEKRQAAGRSRTADRQGAGRVGVRRAFRMHTRAGLVRRGGGPPPATAC
jgi:hypothetical protein